MCAEHQDWMFCGRRINQVMSLIFLDLQNHGRRDQSFDIETPVSIDLLATDHLFHLIFFR